jgi:diguanylate cyclase (GGDEF)-like protein
MFQRRAMATTVGRAVLIAVLLGCALVLPNLGPIKQIDDRMLASRFQLAPRPASQQLVFVAIDKRSLDAVGTWPWPRGVYAQLLDMLSKSGAQDIFLDVDFSTPSNEPQDELLATALSNVGGGVILPVFTQRPTATKSAEPVVTKPVSRFAANSWLASANVNLDTDGLVRRFELGMASSDGSYQSVPAVLSKSTLSAGSLALDLSIQPATVPTYSLSDVLSGSVGSKQLRGRSVVVGAYATELKDFFAVPVYGALSGPMINILGAETLLQGRLLRDVDMIPFQLLLSGVIIVGALILRNRPILLALTTVVILGASLEFGAFLLQKHSNLLVHTTTSWMMLLVGLFLVMNEQLDLSGIINEFAGAEQRNTRRLLQKVVAENTDAVIIFDHRLKVIEQSQAATTLFGIDTNEPQRVLQDFVPAEVLMPVRSLISDIKTRPTTSHSTTSQFVFPTPEGLGHFEVDVTVSPIEQEKWSIGTGAFVGCLSIRNITARQLYQDKLRQLAESDELTGLLNRRAFTARLATCDGPYFVVALDLHRFSVINATLGRATGDALLRAVGQRLSLLDDAEVVGNFGGNLFCVALKVAEAEPAGERALRLLEQIEQPFLLAQTNIQTICRVGLCDTQLMAKDANLWVEASEQALDDAKIVAGRGWSCYDPSVALRQARSKQLERDMRESLENGEFFLLYQPQVDLRSGIVTGAEALVRWRHPDLGIVSPLEFVAIAEANGFICDIGRFVLNEACREAASWPAGTTVAVNVSSIQFLKSDIVSDVRAAIDASGLQADRLQLEITESSFVSRTDELVRTLTEFRDQGIGIALDDFGTGYSSLSYVGDFPLDKLKIDQSFVRKMISDPGSQAIVQAVSSLAHSLSLDIVAEGIETEAEWKMLALIGCQYGQGYYFGKPQSADAFLTLVGDSFEGRVAERHTMSYGS